MARQEALCALVACLCAFTVNAATQVTIGTGSSLVLGNNTINGVVSCTLSDKSNSTCLSVTSKAMPNHKLGNWCSGGNWNNTVVDYTSIAANCNCQRSSCTSTCSDLCLECPPLEQNITYHIPLAPAPAAATARACGDNNHGDGIALNSVPLAPADPLAMLSGANNPAPLDWFGGHATLQYVYHYHSVPSHTFNCSSGWDATNHVWATAAADGLHSTLIGWAFDGYPMYGLFSTGGALPSDLDACYGHTHEPLGYHYHGKDIHDGVTHAFLGCFKGKRAVQPWDAQSSCSGTSGGGSMGGMGGPGGGTGEMPGAAAGGSGSSSVNYTCPATATVAAHTTTLGAALKPFDLASCLARSSTASSSTSSTGTKTSDAASPPPPRSAAGGAQASLLACGAAALAALALAGN